jgi:hypothetical protein
MGMMVCRIYKALFAFLLLSASAVLAVLALDIKVWLTAAGGSSSTKGMGGSADAYREIGGEKTRRAGGFGLGGFGFGLKERAKTWRERGVGYESNTTAAGTGTRGAPEGLQERGAGGRGLRELQLSPGYSDGGDVGDSQRLVMESPDMVSFSPCTGSRGVSLACIHGKIGARRFPCMLRSCLDEYF